MITDTDREAENFLANKVPEKYMRRYNKHLSMNKAQHKGKRKAPDSITPDIQVLLRRAESDTRAVVLATIYR